MFGHFVGLALKGLTLSQLFPYDYQLTLFDYRYRNFRTFTAPRPCQFFCLALDASGEIICAGSLDTFEIFMWSMQTGRLLEVSSIFT